MKNNTVTKYLLDTLSCGQIVWANLQDEYDRVVIGVAQCFAVCLTPQPAILQAIPIPRPNRLFR
jgi:hypothetical protein